LEGMKAKMHGDRKMRSLSDLPKIMVNWNPTSSQDAKRKEEWNCWLVGFKEEIRQRIRRYRQIAELSCLSSKGHVLAVAKIEELEAILGDGR